MNNNFKVGDRVVGVGSYQGMNINGREGTVKGISPVSMNLAVEFDEYIGSGLHSCNKQCEKGWYCPSKNLKLIEDTQSIHITIKGNETIAVLKNGKETVKIAKAKCSPSDEFKLEIGAKLAVERLFGMDKSSVREVKRIAKVGEYIKIVEKGCHGPSLVVGDIHKVTKVKGRHEVCTDKTNVFFGSENEEYVVLENYQPEPIPGMPKVGDKIRIVKKGSHLPNLNIGDMHTIIEIGSGGIINTNKRNSFSVGEYDEFEIINILSLPLSSYASEELLEELLRREK